MEQRGRSPTPHPLQQTAATADQILSAIRFEERKAAIRFIPGYSCAFVDAGWITASEYDHHCGIKIFHNESVFRVFQWLDLHEARLVPIRSSHMERTYYNPRQSSTPSTSPRVSGTPMSVSPIPTIRETSARTASPTYSPESTLRYPDRPASPDPLPNYIVISSDDEPEVTKEDEPEVTKEDEPEVTKEDEPKSALVSDNLEKLMKKEKQKEKAEQSSSSKPSEMRNQPLPEVSATSLAAVTPSTSLAAATPSTSSAVAPLQHEPTIVVGSLKSSRSSSSSKSSPTSSKSRSRSRKQSPVVIASTSSAIQNESTGSMKHKKPQLVIRSILRKNSTLPLEWQRETRILRQIDSPHRPNIINSLKPLFLRTHYINRQHASEPQRSLVTDLASDVLGRRSLNLNEEKAARSDLLNQFKRWRSEYKENVKTLALKVKQSYIDDGHYERNLIELIHNHDVRIAFTQWLLIVDHGPDELAFPSLKTYLIKTVRDFIEFENQDGSFINDIFSTWDFLVSDIHVDSTLGHNWGESVDLSIYAEAVKKRAEYLTMPSLSEGQKAYLAETAIQLDILKEYENTKRIR